jgi:hypothetical protein
MPRAAPVMTATLPDSFMASLPGLLQAHKPDIGSGGRSPR